MIPTMKINIKVKACPFCGGLAKDHPNPHYQTDYVAIYHELTCWLNEDKAPYNFTLLPRTAIKVWNHRSGAIE